MGFLTPTLTVIPCLSASTPAGKLSPSPPHQQFQQPDDVKKVRWVTSPSSAPPLCNFMGFTTQLMSNLSDMENRVDFGFYNRIKVHAE